MSGAGRAEPMPQWRRRMRIARRRIGSALLPLLGPSALRALAGTWRVERMGEEHLGGGGRLLAMWHGRMLVGLPTHRDRGWFVLVSPSDDGGLVTLLLDRFGYRVVRGSSSRGGARALRVLSQALRDERTVVITPDGPRGPRHAMNPGLAWMARESGLPIVPCGFVCDRAWRLRSWDRFTIPKLGARVALAYGEPVRVPRDADDAALAERTERVRGAILAAERGAFDALGVADDWSDA